VSAADRRQHRTDPGSASPHLRLSVALGALATLLTIAQAWSLATLVDGVFLDAWTPRDSVPALTTLIVLAVARALLAWGSESAAQRGAAIAKHRVRSEAVQSLVARGPARLSAERAGEVVNTLVAGVDALDGYLAKYLPQTRLSLASPAIVLIAVVVADPLSGLVLALTCPLIPLFMVLVGAAARRRTERQWVTLSRMSARFLDALEGLPTLRAFGRTDAEAATLAERSERFRRLTMDVLRLAFVSALVLELLATLGTAVVAVEVGLRLLYARVAFRDALFVLVLAPEFYRPLRALGAAYHAGLAGREALARLDELRADDVGGPGASAEPLERAGEAAARVDGPTGGAWRPVLREPPAISFDAVSFRYDRGRPPALDAVSFRVPPGEVVALVGANGGGKSTCARLLMRFLDPDTGAVRVNGRALTSWNAGDWRGNVAWVPQHPHLFHGTVRDNLLLACPDADEDAIARALDAASAAAFVAGLPQGLDTPVGEGGARLSGGQAQRIALARAFLRDAPLLVLDEPTAHVDAWTMPAIDAAMRRLCAGRTVLLIAHRLSTIRAAGSVVVLNGGRVEACGRHEDLIRTRGWYRTMASTRGGGDA
jgi:thiol reductant ABC exporter CydD subunit